jgi:hypothetical protein
VKILRNKFFWLKVGLASSFGWILGSDNPMLVILPIGPCVILWSLLPSTMNIWNRVGACWGIGVVIQALTAGMSIFANTVAWQLFLLMGVVKYFNRKTNSDPIFKLIAISALVVFIAGVYERIYAGAFRDFNTYKDRLNLLGLILAKVLYGPPFIIVYGTALFFEQKSKEDVPIGPVKSEEVDKTLAS